MEDTVRVERGRQKLLLEPHVEYTVTANHRAKFASAFVERLGVVACVPDGEDTAGRQRYRLATPQELVDRACETAQLLYEKFEASGWLTEIPEAPKDDETKSA